MIDIKDEIKNLITMKDIMSKYGIKHKGNMYNCPFHKDQNASAKFYRNSFYCFSCNKTGDLIQFVQLLYNLTFQEAMQKINVDFGLGLDNNTKIDRNKILEIERRRREEELAKKRKNENYIRLADQYRELRYEIDRQLKLVNIVNWENKVFEISKLQDKLGLLEFKIEKELETF